MQAGAGKAGKLLPDDGETPRGIAMRLGRAAKRMDKQVDVRVADGAVYFAVEE